MAAAPRRPPQPWHRSRGPRQSPCGYPRLWQAPRCAWDPAPELCACTASLKKIPEMERNRRRGEKQRNGAGGGWRAGRGERGAGNQLQGAGSPRAATRRWGCLRQGSQLELRASTRSGDYVPRASSPRASSPRVFRRGTSPCCSPSSPTEQQRLSECQGGENWGSSLPAAAPQKPTALQSSGPKAGSRAHLLQGSSSRQPGRCSR